MKFSRFIFICLLVCGRVVGASNTSAWVQALHGQDDVARLAALNALESQIARASHPAADAGQRAALERELLGYTASTELPEMSRAYLIRLLPPIATEATVRQMLQLVSDPKTSRMLGNDAAGLLALLVDLVPADPLLQSLLAAGDPARELLWSAIALRADPRMAKPLVKLLKKNKLPLHDLGIQALGAMGGRAAASYLFAQWELADGPRRIVLARAIAHTGATKAAELKKLCLGSDVSEVRAAALRQWGSKNEAAALQFLQSQLDAGAPDLDVLIAVQLASGGGASWKWITARAATLPESALITVLRSIEEQERKELESWVLQRLEGASEPVELAAVRCLAAVGGSKSIDALVARSKSPSGKLSAGARSTLAVLKDASLDARLQETIADPQHPFYLTALELLSLRNSPGSIVYFNQLFSESSPRGEVLAAGLRGLERLGNIDSVKLLLVRLPVEKDPAVIRALQISLKRVAIRLEQPDRLWKEAILPALGGSAGGELEARVLPLLDAVPTSESLAYCVERVKGPDAVLARAADQALIRWRGVEVCDYWLSVLNDQGRSEDDREQAVRFIDLVLRADSNADFPKQVAEKAGELFLASENKALRANLIAVVGGLGNRWKKSFYTTVSPHLGNLTDYSDQLEALNKSK